MGTARVIAGCAVGLLALAMVVYVSFTVRRKGPIFSNTWLLLSPKERERADKNAEYRLVSVIFGGLSAVFAFLCLHIFTLWIWPFVLTWVTLAFVMVYAIADAVRTEKNSKKR